LNSGQESTTKKTLRKKGGERRIREKGQGKALTLRFRPSWDDARGGKKGGGLKKLHVL